MSSRARLPLLSILFLSLSAAPALADIGSVFSTAQTDSTITINWTPPASPYSHCHSTPSYKVCIKTANNLQIACNQFSDFTSINSYMFTGLTSNTLYKIRVFANTKKYTAQCDYRDVATLEQKTKPTLPPPPVPGAPPPVPYGHLSIAATGPGSFTAVAEFSPGDGVAREKVRICYKQSWWLMNLVGACKNPWSWGNAYKGAIEYLPPLNLLTQHTFSGLPECREFKVVAYGYPGEMLLGEGTVRTGSAAGSCPKVMVDLTPDVILGQLVLNHESVAQQYQTATDQHLRSIGKRNGLVDVLVDCDPSVTTELQTLAAGHETVTTDVDLLDYISYRGNPLLACWQSSPSIPRGLTLQSYLSINHPAVLDQIRADLDPPR